MTEHITLADGHVITLHYRHWIPRFCMRFKGGINLCMTLSAKHIYVSQDWITARTLAHEVGHTFQARRLGWRYLPWVLLTYLRSGYTHSKAEVEADEYMDKYAHLFQNHGHVPPWVRG